MIYLDNSATSFPKPESVYAFMNDFYRFHGVSPGRSGFDAAIEAEEMVNDTRKLLTNLFNGIDHNRLTFSYNASDSLNMVIQGLCQKGDHVITTMLEHNSVLRPLFHLSQDGMIQVSHIPFDSNGYIDPQDIAKAIQPNTKMVVVNHCSNVIGTIQPLSEIGKICREREIIFVVDASQSAGAIPIDMQASLIDVLVFTGHKCLMGPTGIGGSYVMEHVPIRGTRFGGTGVRSAQETHLSEFPYRMECGTLNLLGVAGLKAGVEWITAQGVQRLHDQEMTLWTKLRDGLLNVPGITLYCANRAQNHNPVLSLNVDGMISGDIGTLLDVDYNIACRTGLQCAPKVHQSLGTDLLHGTVRFSIGPFNKEEEIQTAISAMEEISLMSTKINRKA